MQLFLLTTSYLLGSIPFGLLLTRAAGLGDVRSIGSGTIGATNVMRTGNKKLGIATLLLDAGKGFLAVWIAKHFGLEGMWLYAAALAAVLGHVFPVWLKFKGGKGVATAIGVVFALNPWIGLWICGCWLIGLLGTRYVSFASIECLWSVMIIMAVLRDLHGIVFYILLAALITWTHRTNIKRIRSGTEPKIGKKKA
jgi:glycerol-3-phosphate acyltransferase PlsY